MNVAEMRRFVMRKEMIRFVIGAVLLVGNLIAGGLMVSSSPENLKIVELSRNVEVSVENDLAKTVILQEFKNYSTQRGEAYFLFPLPENAVVKAFSMEINGKEMPAELLDASKARSIYEEIVRKSKDPALFEYLDRKMYKIRIFPVQPGETKRIRLTLVQSLASEGGLVSYEYRINGISLQQGGASTKISGSFELTSSQPISHFATSIKNPTFEFSGDKRKKFFLKPGSWEEDGSFTCDYISGKNDYGVSLSTMKESGNEGYLRLRVVPSTLDFNRGKKSERELIFLLDTSGSMAGKKLEEAKKALLYCIRALPEGGFFNVIRFSTEAEALSSEVLERTEDSLQKAETFIRSFQATGGTHISEALQIGLQGKDPARQRVLVMITDGKPTIGETDVGKLIDLVNKQGASVRVFSIGIGVDLDTRLIDLLSEKTRSAKLYIPENGEIELKLSAFFDKIRHPAMTDVSVTFSGDIRVSQTTPGNLRLPDLFYGSELEILGKYTGTGKCQMLIQGRVNGENVKNCYEFQIDGAGDGNAYLPLIWATRRVNWLLENIRLNGENKELTDEIITLSKKFGIVTPYTSWLILEDEEQSPQTPISREGIDILLPPSMVSRAPQAKKDFYSYSGEGSVKTSSDLQESSRFSAEKSAKNDNGNLERRYVSRKVFISSEGIWKDTEIFKANRYPALRLSYGSDAYFEYVRKNPETGKFLALGRSVQFVHLGIHVIVE